jgi:hypothetical protein
MQQNLHRCALAEGEANAPLVRATLGGLLAGEPATLFVLPAVEPAGARGIDEVPEALDHVSAPAGPAH